MRLLIKIAHGLRFAWAIVGISLLLFLLVEFTVTLFMANRQQNDASDAYWALLGDEKDRDILDVEIRATQGTFHTHSRPVVWEPFCYWRGRPFTGQYVNIDREGLRRTPELDTVKVQKSERLEVFMFGGSTTWGANVSDRETIPAHLNWIMQKDGVPSSVRNFGQIGYVSTQECIALLRECQRGNVPDIAVFYDGVNDVASLQQHCRAGLSINSVNRRDEFNLSLRGTTGQHIKQIVRNSAIATLLVSDQPRSLDPVIGGAMWQQHIDDRRADPKVIERIERIMNSADNSEGTARERVAQLLVEDKALELLSYYSATIRMIRAIGDEYGFETWFFWQPVIFTKKHLSPEEQDILIEEGGSELIYIAVYNALLKIINVPDGPNKETLAPLHRVVYLGNAFEQEGWNDKQAFLDLCHVTSDANELIARLIWEQMKSHITVDID